MLQEIKKYMHRPKLYAPSNSKFWDDPHISKGMLSAHLTPTLDSATRNTSFVDQSTRWIAQLAPPMHYPNLLDLGCGPGIYAERFHDAGYQVSGIDLSGRSIEYAKNSADALHKQIRYQVADYLALDFSSEFDIATLIYCDFGALSTDNRAKLLQRIHATLRPGGILLFDVFTPNQYVNISEYQHWHYEERGFWSQEPALCLESFYRYEEDRTFMNQYIVLTAQDFHCYNIWDHTFTQDELSQDLQNAGFMVKGFYADVGGAPFIANSKQFCVVAKRS